jgi:hypothetical protein
VYIFFSNRVYPTRDDHMIYKLNIRTSIQQALYDAIQKEKGSLLPEKIMLGEYQPAPENRQKPISEEKGTAFLANP